MKFAELKILLHVIVFGFITSLNGFTSDQHAPSNTSFAKKRCTVLVYVTSRNSLSSFLERNLQQLMQVGTNDDVTFLVHLDLYGSWTCKLTQRFIIYKNHMVQVGEDSQMDGGDPETLRDACKWAFGNFPSDMTVLVLWNHGSGDIEPSFSRTIDPSVFYISNPTTNLLELNRSMSYLEYLEQAAQQQRKDARERGICFDDCTNHFLTNHQVGEVLRDIQHTCLAGRPLDILYCDACLMMGIGFAYSLKPYRTKPCVRYLVASQEVTLAYGFDYAKLFSKLAVLPITAHEFARDAVQVFAEYYKSIAYDYTQSALCMEKLDYLYSSVDALGNLLIEGLQKQSARSVKNFIRQSSSRNNCISFEEPSYKDLHHLLTNMLNNIDAITLNNQAETACYKQRLSKALQSCCAMVDYVVIANSTSDSLKNAHGISIYVPYDKVYPTFPLIDFAQHTSWLNMLSLYVNS